MTPKQLHRSAALLEMFTWTFLIIAMIAKYSGMTEAIVPIAGGIHGFGFLCFAVITVVVWLNNRWTFTQGIAGLIVSVIPWAALPFTLWADKKGLLSAGWRFADPAEKPSNVADKALALLVRRPWQAIAVIIVVIVVVYVVLLNLGQPYDPDAIVSSASS